VVSSSAPARQPPLTGLEAMVPDGVVAGFPESGAGVRGRKNGFGTMRAMFRMYRGLPTPYGYRGDTGRGRGPTPKLAREWPALTAAFEEAVQTSWAKFPEGWSRPVLSQPIRRGDTWTADRLGLPTLLSETEASSTFPDG